MFKKADEELALRRDAMRYRWLRRRDLDTIDMGGLFVGKTPENIVLNGVDLDFAIDEAMKEHPISPQPTVTLPTNEST
jgi:hypothetical protein